MKIRYGRDIVVSDAWYVASDVNDTTGLRTQGIKGEKDGKSKECKE